jgi:hypothetical protein
MRILCALLLCIAASRLAQTQDSAQPPLETPSAAQDVSVEPATQNWNIHGQVTETPQGDLGFRALYSGPNSLNSKGEVQETFTSDLYLGARLWHGGEIHADGLLWKGFGLSNDKGIEAFPNGDAFKLGIKTPYFMFAHLASVKPSAWVVSGSLCRTASLHSPASRTFRGSLSPSAVLAPRTCLTTTRTLRTRTLSF